MNVKMRKAAQTEETRRALLDAARALFTDKGYAETSTEDIVQRAGVTRGALYHHFRDKQDLFRALYEEVEKETMQNVAETSVGTDVWAMMISGTRAYLGACLDPTVQRITLLDGPSVLDFEALHAISEKYAVALVRHVLEAAMEQGVIEKHPVDPLTHVVCGALYQSALMIARAEKPQEARVEVEEALVRMLEGLRVPSGPKKRPAKG